MNRRRRILLALALVSIVAAWYFGSTRDWSQSIESENERELATESLPRKESLEAPGEEEVGSSRELAADPQSVSTAPISSDLLSAAEEGVRLHGLVLSVEGTSVQDPSMKVVLSDRLGTKVFSEIADGEYSFTELEDGRYWLAARCSLGDAHAFVDIEKKAGDRRVDLQLVAHTDIQIEVVDAAGEPLRGIALLAVATTSSPGDWVDLVPSIPYAVFGVGTWTENGNADVNYPEGVYGRIRLSAPPPVFVSIVHLQRVVATQRVAVGQTSVRFTLDPAAQVLQKGTLHLRLIDAKTRQPLAMNLQLIQNGLTNISTDVDGHYTGGVLPGWLSVRLWGKGSVESPDRVVRAEPGVLTDLGEIALDAPVTISGAVVDESGQGLPVRVRYDLLEPTSGRAILQTVQQSAHTAADGTFTVVGLGRGRYRLRVIEMLGNLASREVIVDTRGGSVEGVRIQLEHGTPVVIRASDERWPSTTFQILDAAGTVVIPEYRFRGPEPQPFLLARGRYEVEVRVADVVDGARRPLIVAESAVEMALP